MENIQLLANAIVKQAAEDYRVALVEQHDLAHGTEKEQKAIEKKIAELEEFFTGKWFRLLTKLDGTTLMHDIKAEVIEYDYDLEAIKKSHGLVEA